MDLLFDTYALVCLVGVGLSVYAWHVEKNKKANKDYVALCDFGPNMQCSRVLTSEYSVGFGIFGTYFGSDNILNKPNCELGIAFYSLQILILALVGPFANVLLFICSIASCIMSIYLAYLLAFKLRDFCVVCIGTYISRKDSYVDPQAGYTVLTLQFHIKKGKCCGNGCRHCPYKHENVPPSNKGSVGSYNGAFYKKT